MEHKHFNHHSPAAVPTAEQTEVPLPSSTGENLPDGHDRSAVIGNAALAGVERRPQRASEREPTITVVVMPADEVQALERRQIDRGYKAGQRIVGGLIQPVDLPTVGATIWVNEEGLLLGLPLNVRATKFLWTHQPEYIDCTVLVGDAYVTGLPNRHGDTTSVPDGLATQLLAG